MHLSITKNGAKIVKNTLSLLAILAGLAGWGFAQEPNYISTKTLSDGTDLQQPVESRTYDDGFGKRLRRNSAKFYFKMKSNLYLICFY